MPPRRPPVAPLSPNPCCAAPPSSRQPQGSLPAPCRGLQSHPCFLHLCEHRMPARHSHPPALLLACAHEFPHMSSWSSGLAPFAPPVRYVIALRWQVSHCHATERAQLVTATVEGSSEAQWRGVPTITPQCLGYSTAGMGAIRGHGQEPVCHQPPSRGGHIWYRCLT